VMVVLRALFVSLHSATLLVISTPARSMYAPSASDAMREQEQVVERDTFEVDELQVPAAGHDHWSLCKPNQF
jgi:hypothetical protein